MAPAEVIDLSSDTDDDDLSPDHFFKSLSTVAGGSSFGGASRSASFTTTRPNASRATSFASSSSSRVISAPKAAPAPLSSANVARSSSLMDVLDAQAQVLSQSQTTVRLSSTPSRAASLVSSLSSPKKRAASSRASSDTEDDLPAPKKRKAPASKAPARSAATTAQQKAAKLIEKAEAKVNALLEKEAEKKRKAELNAVNKLVKKKEDYLRDFTLCVASGLQDTPFMRAVASRLDLHGCDVRYLNSSHEPALVRWQRRVDARYDEEDRQWVPVPEYRRFEATNLIYVRAEDLLSQANANGIELLHERVQQLRRDAKLSSKHQVFIMIDDMEQYYRKKGKGSRAANASAREAGYELVSKQLVERALARLQVAQRCFIVHVEGVKDAAEWIYNITADIGVKPHKLIERSHLPFCPLLTVSSGSDCADTYQKMLEQLKQVTEGRARAVRSLRPNLRSLFEAYEAEPDPDRRSDMLTNAVVDYRQDGAVSGKILNIALSSKIAATFWTHDSLARLA